MREVSGGREVVIVVGFNWFYRTMLLRLANRPAFLLILVPLGYLKQNRLKNLIKPRLTKILNPTAVEGLKIDVAFGTLRVLIVLFASYSRQKNYYFLKILLLQRHMYSVYQRYISYTLLENVTIQGC